MGYLVAMVMRVTLFLLVQFVICYQVGSGTGITDRSEKSIQRPDKPDRSEISGRCPTYLMSCYFCTSNA